jgi:5-methyltetrahydropteroyltriglutamate--homocysteine methyltransferase
MIETSVVGSYPVSCTKEEIETAHKDNVSWTNFFLPSIKTAVNDQISAGIDIISTGQVRTDMISEFTRAISGVREHNSEKYVVSKIKFVKPITLDDLIYTRSLFPEAIKKIKAPITGAYTLAKSCRITEDSGYKNLEQIAFDFAHVLNKEARAIEPYVDIIQIDEPFFSCEFPEYAKEIVSIVRQGIKIPVALHVCGDVSNIFQKLIDFDVDILDHEFAGNPDLLKRIASVSFCQRIGYGIVKSYDPEIESVDKILKILELAIKFIPERKLILKPDCGLRNLPREVAYQKLANIVKARNQFYGIETVETEKIKLEKKDFDTRGYFYIVINQRDNKIRVEHYTYDHILSKVIQGTNAESIRNEIQKLGLTAEDNNGKRHFGYLGTELGKAEIALRNNLDYTQDKMLKLEKDN